MFEKMPIQLQAAAIGALVTLVGIIVRDGALKALEHRRERKRTARQVFRRYADPLVSAAGSLLWRLNEIFTDGERATYLLSQVTIFEKYKRVSTLYRVAALIAWIRAFRRELSFLETSSRRKLASLKEAVRSFESALADGPHVEFQRLEALTSLWGLPVPVDDRTRKSAAVVLNNVLQHALASEGCRVATDLPLPKKEELCRTLASELCGRFGSSRVPDEVVTESIDEAILALAVKEAWLFRDWQAAVGDLLIRKSDHEGRAFEVIGFGEFERFLAAEGDENQQWRERLVGLIDKLDVSRGAAEDARIEQLRSAMSATAQLVVALVAAQPRRELLLENTLALAQRVREQAESEAPSS